jgi:hypothetical protein
LAKNLLDVRFGVKRDDSYESSVWRLWVTRYSDTYLAVRSHAGVSKYSFHKSGICRSAFTSQHGTPATMADRAIFEWTRNPTAARGTNQASRVAWIAFPTNFLSKPRGHGLKDINWIKAAPSDQATYFELAYTCELESDVRLAFESRKERTLMNYLLLPSGEALISSYYHSEWDNRDLRSPTRRGSIFPDLLFSERDPGNTGRPVRITFGPLPKDGDALVLQELGGCQDDQ